MLVALTAATLGLFAQFLESDVSPSRRHISLLARESVGRLMVLILMPLGRKPAPPPQPWSDAPALDGSTHLPVVFVPGYGTNRSVFWPLCQYLSGCGWRWLWAVNHGGKETRIPAHVDRLDRRIGQILERSGAPQVDLVGFSMGGIICASYLSAHGGDRVRRLVTIGTPWQGTRLAKWARHSSGRDLQPGSATLERLLPAPVPVISIWSPDDTVVVPARSASPPGVSHVRIEGAGHVDLLLSSRGFRAIANALAEPTEDDAP